MGPGRRGSATGTISGESRLWLEPSDSDSERQEPMLADVGGVVRASEVQKPRVDLHHDLGRRGTWQSMA